MPLSKILSLAFILPIVVVVVELKFKRSVIEANRKACDMRADKIRAAGMKAEELLGRPLNTFEELGKATKEALEFEDGGYKEVNEWIRGQEPKLFRLRKWSLRFLVAALSGVVAIILNENGTFAWLLGVVKEFLCKIS